jgi:TPR repeat protein
LYEFAADAGLAQGAMALAATFDADELAKLGVRGVASDPKEARRWYERARQLGATDAPQRISRLGAQYSYRLRQGSWHCQPRILSRLG